jgi:hypothetical protein
MPERSDAKAICPGPPPSGAGTPAGVAVNAVTGVFVTAGVKVAVGGTVVVGAAAVTVAVGKSVGNSVAVDVEVEGDRMNGTALRIFAGKSPRYKVKTPAHAMIKMNKSKSHAGLRRRRLIGGIKGFSSWAVTGERGTLAMGCKSLRVRV